MRACVRACGCVYVCVYVRVFVCVCEEEEGGLMDGTRRRRGGANRQWNWIWGLWNGTENVSLKKNKIGWDREREGETVGEQRIDFLAEQK